MKERDKRFIKKLLIIALFYANIFTISFLFGALSRLQDMIVDLQIDRVNRMKWEQEVSEYLRIHGESEDFIWPEKEEDLVL